MLIWLLCGSAVFVIAILGNLIVRTPCSILGTSSDVLYSPQCPTEYVFSTQELASSSLNSDPSHMLVAIRGEAFDLTKFAPLHLPGNNVIPLVRPISLLRVTLTDVVLFRSAPSRGTEESTRPPSSPSKSARSAMARTEPSVPGSPSSSRTRPTPFRSTTTSEPTRLILVPIGITRVSPYLSPLPARTDERLQPWCTCDITTARDSSDTRRPRSAPWRLLDERSVSTTEVSTI